MKNVAAPLASLSEAYEANSLSRQKPWEAMGMSRAKWYLLGKPSPQQSSETSPSPITNGEALAVELFLLVFASMFQKDIYICCYERK